MTVSLCMIVKNEEAVFARCLDSVTELVDEVVIVDTGSTDKTREISRRYTKKVFDFKWTDDFSAARNYAFGKAAMDYQMWLDANDILEESQREKFSELKNALTADVDIVTMKYHTDTDDAGALLFSSTRERLLKRERQ